MNKYIINKSEALRYMGYKNQKISCELDNEIDEMIDFCKRVAKPKYCYDFFDLTILEKEVKFKSSDIVLSGKDIYNHLKKAKKCAILAVTTGAELERELLRRQKISVTQGVILDAVASAYTESITDSVENEIIGQARKIGYYTNLRYSPGYGDFPINTQSIILNLLSCEKRIGLTVNDSSLLIPHKSVTAVIGLFDSSQTKKDRNCSKCNLYNNCKLRMEEGICEKY